MTSVASAPGSGGGGPGGGAPGSSSAVSAGLAGVGGMPISSIIGNSIHSPTPSLTMARSLSQSTVEELHSMSPFDLFRSQMEAGSTEAKVDAMKRLNTVAYAMGTEATLSTLIPYLNNVAMKQPPHEDELLLLLANKLQTLVPTLINSRQVASSNLLPILERLAAVEETVVRDEAVRGINHIANYFKEPALLVAMVKRLIGADWFTPKVSAAGIMAKVYELSLDLDTIPLYKELSADDTPMVRRSAAKHLGSLLNVVTYDRAVGKNGGNPVPENNTQHYMVLVNVLQQLCNDEQDSVRLLAVASLANVGQSFAKHPEWTSIHFLPLLKDGATDMSWRVRHNLAKHFSDVAINLGIQGISKYSQEQNLVLACFVLLLTDAEAEVRAAAVGHFARMVHWGGSALFQTHLQPLLPSLADDVVMEVRSKCALALMDASQGGTLEDSLILQAFGPLVESFLQDEFHEVQLQVLTNLQKMAHLLNGMGGVVTSIINMSKATNWRVREAVAKLLPHLAEARGLEFFATVLLEPAWLTLLLDPVANVRLACVYGMAYLTKVAGQDWIIKHVLPQHVRLYNNAANTTYLIRITIIQAHTITAIAAKSGTLWHDCVLQILRGLNDKVANVRMVSAIGLAKVLSGGNALYYHQNATTTINTGGAGTSSATNTLHGLVWSGLPPIITGHSSSGPGAGGAGGIGDHALGENDMMNNNTAAMNAVSLDHGVKPGHFNFTGDPAVVKAQICPALEKRNSEEDDEDCRNAYQIALEHATAATNPNDIGGGGGS